MLGYCILVSPTPVASSGGIFGFLLDSSGGLVSAPPAASGGLFNAREDGGGLQAGGPVAGEASSRFPTGTAPADTFQKASANINKGENGIATTDGKRKDEKIAEATEKQKWMDDNDTPTRSGRRRLRPSCRWAPTLSFGSW